MLVWRCKPGNRNVSNCEDGAAERTSSPTADWARSMPHVQYDQRRRGLRTLTQQSRCLGTLTQQSRCLGTLTQQSRCLGTLTQQVLGFCPGVWGPCGLTQQALSSVQCLGTMCPDSTGSGHLSGIWESLLPVWCLGTFPALSL